MNEAPGGAAWNTPRGLLQRLRRTFRSPSDIVLAAQLGWFLFTLPRRMARCSLPELLVQFERSPRLLGVSLERVVRLRGLWLARVFPSRNTCYMRALCVYRFLTRHEGRALRIHFGVEPGVDPGDRLRGHAWLTLDGGLLESPESVVEGRVKEIYAYPQVARRTAEPAPKRRDPS